jgi:hypothetical protein
VRRDDQALESVVAARRHLLPEIGNPPGVAVVAAARQDAEVRTLAGPLGFGRATCRRLLPARLGRVTREVIAYLRAAALDEP